MKRILVTASGGAPSMGFVRSLRDAPEPFYIVGCDCNKYKLMLSETDESILVPRANNKMYIPFLKALIKEKRIDFVHCQPDIEVGILSEHRNELGALTFMPDAKVVEILRNKATSFSYWKRSGLKVPETILINNENDLKEAFRRFRGNIWLREIEGAAGKGSLSAPSYELAKQWIDARGAWTRYTAAERLTNETITWMSIYKDGELIVAQGRKRLYWEFANRAQSGVTGITGTGMTVSDPVLDKIAQKAIYAVDGKPNGIFSVDLTYDDDGIPNPTEINIGKFFTTHYFFTKAGLNMPYIYIKLAFSEEIPKIDQRINPLSAGLFWIRGMDKEPVLSNKAEIKHYEDEYDSRLAKT